jgi:putative membrane protein
MRTALLLTAAALALTACGHKDDNTAATDSNMSASDNMTVAENESTDNSAMQSAGSATVSSADFVKNAALSDMYEITSSKLAATMATSADLKKFAAQMIAAHTATTAGLKAAIAKDGVKDMPPKMLDAEHQALIDALKATKGADFDTLYKSQQTDAHNKALALMQGYATSGDQPALKAFASDTAPKVKAHLDMLTSMKSGM